MENLNDVIYTLDQNFTVTYISPNVEGLSGFHFEDIIGRNFGNFLLAEEKSILDRSFAKVLSGKDMVIEHRYMTRENKAAWCENSAKPVYEEGGITGVQGTLAKIADRKNTESALPPSNQEFRGFLDHINDAVFIHDMNGRFLEVNEIACSRLGYTRSEMLQMTPMDIDVQGENAWNASNRIQLIKQDEALVFETAHRCKNGEQIPVEINSRRIMYEGVPSILSVARDITERLLKDTEYAQILKTSIDGFWVVDAEGWILEANPAAAKMLGYTQEEMRQLKVSDIDVNENDQQTAQHIEKLRKTGYGRFETRHQRRDGSLIDVEVSSSYLPFDSGRFHAFVRDITERKINQSEQNIIIEVLRLLNSSNSLHELMSEITSLMQAWSGCEAVGIRLCEGGDYPYFETRGFPEEFVFAENSLCEVDADGEFVRDLEGNPVLECMCGNVIRGRFDPNLPFFTENGGFWTNSTTALLASSDEEDRQARTRNRCNGEGYESVALIPLIHGAETLGLLQMNDSRPNCFDQSQIKLFERLAGSLAVGLAQRRAAQALRKSEEKYRLLFENTSLMVSVFDQKGVCQMANRKAASLFGLQPADLIGKSFHAIHPGRGNEFLARICRIIETGKPVYCEDEVFFPEGKYRLFSEVQPLPGPQGQFDQVQIVSQDITERRQAEEALQESEKNYRNLFDNAPVGIFRTDSSGKAILANHAMAHILGFRSPEEVIANFNDLGGQLYIRPERRKQFLKLLKENGYIENFEYQAQKSDGAHIWLSMNAVAIPAEASDAFLIEGFATDITARKHAETEQERLMSAIEQTTEVMVITDTEGTIQFVNPAFEKVTGYTREEALGQNPRILKSEEQDEAFYRELWQTLFKGEEWHGRFINKKKNGTLYTEEAVITPVCDPEDQIINYVAVKRDVTEQLKIEEQLYQAQKMESIGRLAGGIAHDLNNLLSPILGFGEICIEETSADDPRYDSLKEIVNAGKRAQALVRQLLAFGRKQPLQFQSVYVNDLVQNFKKLLRRTLREDIGIEMRLSNSLPLINGDLGQLEQVIMNLAVNAQDAMPNGGRLGIETAEVRLDDSYAKQKEGVTPGSYVKLAISDTGTGMEAYTMGLLFEPFFTTKEKGKGTGLGMSTAYGIIKQHGGNIWAYSEPGMGTTIKVYLPVSTSSPARARDKQEKPSVVRGKETILLVEDDPQVRKFASTALMHYGYSVLTAENGEDATFKLARHEGKVHLLLTDLIMPHMNGRELFEKVAAIYPDVLVLYMSGYTYDVIAHQGVIDEGVNFIEKPFTVKDLALRVRKILDQ